MLQVRISSHTASSYSWPCETHTHTHTHTHSLTGTVCPVVHSTLRLGIALLKGGNEKIQHVRLEPHCTLPNLPLTQYFVPSSGDVDRAEGNERWLSLQHLQTYHLLQVCKISQGVASKTINHISTSWLSISLPFMSSQPLKIKRNHDS